MAHQVPSSEVAETRSFAGPWLRFQSGTDPGNTTWRGSVLCLTRALAGAGSGDAGVPPVAPLAAPGQATGTTNGANPAWLGGPQQAGGAAASGTAGGATGGAPEPTLTIKDGSSSGTGGEQQVAPVQLDICEGWVFWRFDISLQLTGWQRPVQYSVSAGGNTTPTYTFWLPGIGQPMHWGYYSCNGMSSDVKTSAPERTDPTYLWKDLLQLHSAFPLHCLVGGGDQLYNDGVWQIPSLHSWGASADYDNKVKAEWTGAMQAEATHFYLSNYIDSFSTPDVDLAFAQIPQVMMWDDHDIWDGYGSYDPETQNCAVFQGLFAVARRFFLLFQQHTTDQFNAQAQEFLNNDGSEFHFVKWMGPQVVLLGMDMRSQRSKERIMPQSSYDLWKRVVADLPPGPLHLVVLSGIPLIFPKIPTAESLLGCFGRVTRSIPAIKQMARSSGLLDKFDQPEILDDLVDGWVADVHTAERLQFIHMLQEFATNKKLRVSILSGDAHVGGVGQLYSRPKIKPIGDDPLFMQQIISSAIVNAPPPHPVVKMLMRTNFASNVDSRTREKLVRAFYPQHPRTDKLIAQRNWCDVSLVAPPFSPPIVPQDPMFGGLRFVMRVENTHHRRGYADETYILVVPRHPAAAGTMVSTGEPATGTARSGAGPVVIQLPAAQPHADKTQSARQQALPSNAVAPEEGEEQAAAVERRAEGQAMVAGGSAIKPAGPVPQQQAAIAPATPGPATVV